MHNAHEQQLTKQKKRQSKKIWKKNERIWCVLKQFETNQCFKYKFWINNEQFKTNFNCLKFVFDETLLIWNNEKQWFWLFD